MHAINYEFIQADGIGLMRDEAEGEGREIRWDVLMCLWASANAGNHRSWLSCRTLKKRVRINRNESIAGALDFLVKHGAIYEVPHEYREGNEPMHQQIRVWQLTGMIFLNGQWMKYVKTDKEENKDLEYFAWLTAKTIAMGIETPFINRSPDANSSPNANSSEEDRSPDANSTVRLTRNEGKSYSSFKKETIVASATVMPAAHDEDDDFEKMLSQMPEEDIALMTQSTKGAGYDSQGHSELVKYLYEFHRKQMIQSQIRKLATDRTFHINGGQSKFGSADDLFVTDPRFKDYVDDMISACKRLSNGAIVWKTLVGLIVNFDRVSPGQHGWVEWQKAVPLAPDGSVKVKLPNGMKEEDIPVVDVDVLVKPEDLK